MEKEALAVKYRPKTWDDVVGNKNQKMVKNLKAVLQRGNVRTFLLSGPTGCGKTSIARLIRNEVGCSGIDFIEINGANDRGIETIREVIDLSRFSPMSGKSKVFLLDEAHRLTQTSSEALLKVIEEPPEGVYFIFATTNPEKLLATLKTRCRPFEVFSLNPSEVEGLLSKIIDKEEIVGVTNKVIREIGQASKGCPRQALGILDQVRDLKTEEEMLEAICDKPAIELHRASLYKDWQYPTFHLKNFDYLREGTSLYGGWYKLVIKAIWYILHGQIIKMRTVKLGGVETDCRMNFAFILKSGKGKKEIEDIIAKVCDGLGEKVTKPTSYHPEQLVGKVIQKRKTGEYWQEKGHLGDDILIFDDAIELVTSRMDVYRESRRYIITALDPIGKNRITKRQVGIPREEALIYHPNCSIQILLQPFNISDEVVKSGFFRRFLFLLPEIERSKEIYSQKTRSIGARKSQAFHIVVNGLKELKEYGSPSELTFSEKAIERFNELHLLLVEFGEGYGKKVSNFTDMISFSLQDLFLKMIAILANSYKRTEASIFDIEMAFVDLLEFLDSNFEYVEQKVQGSLDYGNDGQPTGNDLKMLSWLKEEGALSYETSGISIRAYEEEISKRFQISPTNARNWYQKHVEKGWIKGKQKGTHDSTVWLTTRLDEDKGDQGDRAITEYQNINTHYAKEKAVPLLPWREIPLLTWRPSEEDRVSPYHPAHPGAPLEKRDVEEHAEEEKEWKWETLLEFFDYRKYLEKVHETKKVLVFDFQFGGMVSRWTIERIWKAGVVTDYELDLAFPKEGVGEPKIKKWIMNFHTRRANELVQLLKNCKY